MLAREIMHKLLNDNLVTFLPYMLYNPAHLVVVQKWLFIRLLILAKRVAYSTG